MFITTPIFCLTSQHTRLSARPLTNIHTRARAHTHTYVHPHARKRTCRQKHEYTYTLRNPHTRKHKLTYSPTKKHIYSQSEFVNSDILYPTNQPSGHLLPMTCLVDDWGRDPWLSLIGHDLFLEFFQSYFLIPLALRNITPIPVILHIITEPLHT